MEGMLRSQRDEIFSDLPEPPAPPSRLVEKTSDPYLTGLENYINAIGLQIKSIQDNEVQAMQTFTQKLQKFKGKTKKDQEEQARLEFQSTILNLRRKRKEFREMEREALHERIKYLESMMQQKQEQDYLRQKLVKLRAIPERTPVYERKGWLDLSGIFSFAFQVAFIILCATTSTYSENSSENVGYASRIDDYYSFYTHIAIMIFIGWGLLGTWLKKYGYSALFFSFYIACLSLEWAFLANGFFHDAKEKDWKKIDFTMYRLVEATLCSTSMVVAYGAVLGKLGILGAEVLFFSIFGTGMWCLNYFINILVLKAADHGGAMTVHLFGGLYGAGASFLISLYWDKKDIDLRTDKHHDLSSTYTSDILSLMGTMFLWVLFPSWNAALAPDTTQHRVAINTLLGLTSSCIFGFILSRVFRRKAFEVRDLQTITLSGGIAMASAHNLIVTPPVSLLIGGVAASCSMVFDIFVVPYLEKRLPANKIKIYDTRHILTNHAIPGLIGGIASIIAVIMNSHMQYGVDTEQEFYRREVPRQGGFQTLCLLISASISLFSGLFVGAVIHFSRTYFTQNIPQPFSDENHFLVPLDFPRAPGSNSPNQSVQPVQ